MLYRFLKFWVRLAMLIFCRRIIINKPENLKLNGPLLLACNHPNSFLDGIMLDILFKQPLYSLARGDVFTKPVYKKLLKAIKILPVYRISEGAENLSINYDTFDDCKQIFQKNGIVVIFSEGKCINEWHLRPLKKGTARLAFASWDAGIPLRILPAGINYSSFRRFGKNLFIHFGEIIEKKNIEQGTADGIRHQSFNAVLELQLKQLVFEIAPDDKKEQRRKLHLQIPVVKKILLFFPALTGWLLHFPAYLPVKKFTIKRTNNNDHFDSVIAAILFFFYPLYVIVLTLIAFFITQSPFAFFMLVLFPFTAWSFVQLKPQMDK